MPTDVSLLASWSTVVNNVYKPILPSFLMVPGEIITQGVSGAEAGNLAAGAPPADCSADPCLATGRSLAADEVWKLAAQLGLSAQAPCEQ